MYFYLLQNLVFYRRNIYVLKEISSLQNPLIKQTLLLKEKSRERKRKNQFVIEGIRELTLAIKGSYSIETILFYDEIISEDEIINLTSNITSSLQIVKITKDVYQKLAYRETTEGIIAIANAEEHTLATVKLKSKNPLLLIAEAPEKPGNIGALLRTADAANVDAVFIANPKTDLYNPNIVRSSVGCIFTNQIATGSTTEIIQFLKQKNINIYAASLDAAVNYATINFQEATAIVVGTEATGLSSEWLTASTANVIIPMQGEIDSMNVSVSAAILIFEAKRQRNFN